MTDFLDGKKIVIFGGSGFIGRHLINNLCRYSCYVEIVTRKTKKLNEIRFLGGLGQVKVTSISDYKEKYISEIIHDTDVVVNLIGILFEKKSNEFLTVHKEIPGIIAKVCKFKKVESLIHISALGIDKNKFSKYASSKLEGEKEVKNEFSNSIIIRPSVVFGKEDNFINLFSKISKISPFLPIIGTPKIEYRKNTIFPKIDFKRGVNFQPVYVGDLAKFIINTINEKNKIYDLAGPNVVSFQEIIKLILKNNKRKRLCLPIPLILASFIAYFLEKLPYPLLTIDQVKLMNNDNVSNKGFKNLIKKVANPKSLEVILPTYIR